MDATTCQVPDSCGLPQTGNHWSVDQPPPDLTVPLAELTYWISWVIWLLLVLGTLGLAVRVMISHHMGRAPSLPRLPQLASVLLVLGLLLQGLRRAAQRLPRPSQVVGQYLYGAQVAAPPALPAAPQPAVEEDDWSGWRAVMDTLPPEVRAALEPAAKTAPPSTCTHVPYASLQTAHAAAAGQAHATGTDTAVTHCQPCNSWHVTTRRTT